MIGKRRAGFRPLFSTMPKTRTGPACAGPVCVANRRYDAYGLKYVAIDAYTSEKRE